MNRRAGTIIFFVAAVLLLATPALANSPIFSVMLGTSAPFMVGQMSKWTALAGVILIEGFIFWKFFRLSVWKSLYASLILNLFSSLIGFLIGIFGNLGDIVGLILVPCVLGLAFVDMHRNGAPLWYMLAAVLGIVAGFPMMIYIPALPPPQPPVVVFLMIISPLVFGFGFTLLLEGLAAKYYLPAEIRWRSLMTANEVSYVFLAVMLIFFAPNPFTFITYGRHGTLRESVQNLESSSNILSMLHAERAPVRYLLGLSKDDSPGPNYTAYGEIGIIQYILEDPGLSQNTALGLAVIDDTLKLPTLSPGAVVQLTISREYFVFCSRIIDAIRKSDQQGFDSTYSEWTAWWKANPSADRLGLFDPLIWIDNIRNDPEIKIVLPPEAPDEPPKPWETG